MLSIYDDVILKISEYLLDKEKIALTMTSMKLDRMKYKFTYREKICVDQIFDLSYFENFECVELLILNRCPKKAKYIYLETMGRAYVPPFVTHLIFHDLFNYESNEYCIPPSVTHLTFGPIFNLSIKGRIPLSVTHLIFGCLFNQPIDNSIPHSVTHLTFGSFFDKPINGNIPSSVKTLILDGGTNNSANIIPSTITHLTLNFWNGLKINIPSSVTHLTFGDTFNSKITGHIPLSVTHLTFGHQFNQPINYMPSIKEIIISEEYNNKINAKMISKIKRVPIDD